MCACAECVCETACERKAKRISETLGERKRTMRNACRNWSHIEAKLRVEDKTVRAYCLFRWGARAEHATGCKGERGGGGRGGGRI